MNLDQIIATSPEIGKRVYEYYPISKKEKEGCKTEKARLDWLRTSYAKRLMVEAKEKKEYAK